VVIGNKSGKRTSRKFLIFHSDSFFFWHPLVIEGKRLDVSGKVALITGGARNHFPKGQIAKFVDGRAGPYRAMRNVKEPWTLDLYPVELVGHPIAAR